MKTEALLLAGLALYLLSRQMSQPGKPSKPGRVVSNVSAADRATIIEALSKHGWPPHELNAAINIESGWRTDARNGVSDASGLIQLMPAWFARHNYRADLPSGRERAAAFRAENWIVQLPWYERYFDEVGRRWRFPGDTYMALAAPAHVGAPDNLIIYDVGGKAWQQNPAWRESPQGPITAGSIRRVLLRATGELPRV